MQWNEKILSFLGPNSKLISVRYLYHQTELKWMATKSSPVPVARPLHIHFLFHSTSFEGEEELPSVIGGKIIKAGSCCRIIHYFSFYEVAAVAVYSSCWKRLLEKCFEGFQMWSSFQILIQSYPNEFVGLCKWKQGNLKHNIWQLFAVALICAYFSISAKFWMLRKTF